MKYHELKIWPEFFDQIITGQMSFQYRFNDRDFNKGDILRLREYDPRLADDNERYTGRNAKVLIQQIWTSLPGLPVGYCILSIKILDVWRTNDTT